MPELIRAPETPPNRFRFRREASSGDVAVGQKDWFQFKQQLMVVAFHI